MRSPLDRSVLFATALALAPLALTAALVPTGSHYGAEITSADALTTEQAYERIAALDGQKVKLRGVVTAACQAKGCWMALRAGDGRQIRVTFRDYGFFVPKELPGATVVAEGTLSLREVPVDEQRHLAADAGRPQAEIDAITAPSREVSLVADGVLVVAE